MNGNRGTLLVGRGGFDFQAPNSDIHLPKKFQSSMISQSREDEDCSLRFLRMLGA
jgi:hypothetical protein